jgi:putative exporter of polyketide antibiotics
MEIIFLIIAIITTILSVWFVNRLVYNSNKEMIKAYKNSDFLFTVHFLLSFLLTTIYFITLCAFNNTIWHLPYLFK